MRELLILDCTLPGTDAAYAAQLGLEKHVEIIRLPSGRMVDCGKADRAVFLPDLRHRGPYPYQIDQVNQQSQVSSWIVCALDANASVLKQYRLQMKPSVLVCTSQDEARQALKMKTAPRESCLVIAVEENEQAAMFADLLKEHLGTWRVNTVTLSQCGSVEAALQQHPSARVILLGRHISALSPLTWPAGIRPYAVITDEDMRPSRSADNTMLLRQAKAFLPQIAPENVYAIHVRNEQWKQEIRSGARKASSLETEPLFCMLDDYGLPSALEDYRSDAQIEAYLAHFDRCEALVRSMKA